MKECNTNEPEFTFLLMSLHHERIFISSFCEKCCRKSWRISIKVFLLYAFRLGTSYTTLKNFGNPGTHNFHKAIL